MSKRIKDNLERGLWCNYRADYVASVWYDLGAVAMSPEDLNDPDLGAYVIQYHKGELPAFNAKRFHKLADLETAMRWIQPDFRKWQLCELEG